MLYQRVILQIITQHEDASMEIYHSKVRYNKTKYYEQEVKLISRSYMCYNITRSSSINIWLKSFRINVGVNILLSNRNNFLM